MNIGQRIKNLREQANIPQSELAKKVGISKQSLYKYENSIITNIPSNKIEKIAKNLNTTPAYLMGWEESMEKKNNAIADIVLRLRSDAELLSIVEDLSALPSDKLQAVKTLISVIKK